jgi:RNA-binding protein
MSTKPPIAYIDIRVFAHATEDPAKVQKAVQNLLPEELAQTLVFEKANCSGHYGNPIILFTAKLEDKKLLPKAVEKIGAELGVLDKEELQEKLKLHVERSNMFLLFDKQSAFLGGAKFSQNDPIHLKIHFKNKTAKQIEAYSKQIGLLP